VRRVDAESAHATSSTANHGATATAVGVDVPQPLMPDPDLPRWRHLLVDAAIDTAQVVGEFADAPAVNGRPRVFGRVVAVVTMTLMSSSPIRRGRPAAH
jgi:hypothetical protein